MCKASTRSAWTSSSLARASHFAPTKPCCRAHRGWNERCGDDATSQAGVESTVAPPLETMECTAFKIVPAPTSTTSGFSPDRPPLFSQRLFCTHKAVPGCGRAHVPCPATIKGGGILRSRGKDSLWSASTSGCQGLLVASSVVRVPTPGDEMEARHDCPAI